ncbi:unnamed protein product [Lota lota]
MEQMDMDDNLDGSQNLMVPPGRLKDPWRPYRYLTVVLLLLCATSLAGNAVQFYFGGRLGSEQTSSSAQNQMPKQVWNQASEHYSTAREEEQTQLVQRIYDALAKHEEQLHDRYVNLTRDSTGRQNRYETLAAERASLQLSNHALTEKRDQIQAQLSTLTKERDQLQGQFSTLTKERDQLQGQFSTLIKERDQLQGQFSTLTKERDQLQGQFSTLTKERDQLQGQFSTLTKERDQLQGQFSTFTKERDQLQGRFSTLTSERDQLQGRFSTLTSERDQLQGRFSTLTSERDQLQGRFSTLTSERDQLQASINVLRNEKLQLQRDAQEVNKLKDAIESRKCPPGWTKFQCSCYDASSDKMTWNDSRQACKSKHADLVVIHSQEEQMFVNSLLPEKTNSWIGLNDISSEGNWTWVDGTTFHVTHPEKETEPLVRLEIVVHSRVDRISAYSRARVHPAVCEKEFHIWTTSLLQDELHLTSADKPRACTHSYLSPRVRSHQWISCQEEKWTRDVPCPPLTPVESENSPTREETEDWVVFNHTRRDWLQ